MNHIGERPTNEMYESGLEIDCQCARCGSSCELVRCTECEDGYIEEDYGDDVVPDFVTVACQNCHGYSGWNVCGSSRQWCEANPLPGRESVKRGKLEWFTIRGET